MKVALLIMTTHLIQYSSSSTVDDDDHDIVALPGCSNHRCGDLEIPYPFGMSKDCYLNKNFRIKCNSSTGSPIPIFGRNLVVTDISTDHPEMTIMWYVGRECYNESGLRVRRTTPDLTIPSLTLSSSKNKFVVLGCDSYAYLKGFDNATKYSMGCMSICGEEDDVPDDGSCSGIGCCQIDIPKGLKDVEISPRSYNKHSAVIEFNPCTYAFVVEQTKFKFSRSFLRNYSETELPVVADWAIENEMCDESTTEPQICQCGGENTTRVPTLDGLQFNCKCKEGYQGNPYLGCQGAAIGFVSIFVSVSWLYLVLKQRKLIQLKTKFFRQNGGLILQQKLSQDQGNSSRETAKIFKEEELKKATLNYDDSTVIGQGGFGTVYKGILPDNRIVAIKKSKLVDQNQTEQFINEVVVLSQINHRNVVQLLGCCLETEVPLLVYEFVPNGTLSEHIHNKENSSKLFWEIRLRIAAETAEALSYLHSAASTPIIHRDVKPSNILLDNYTAKVSDFGASKLVPIDQTELATMVQGTLGYLDPEYLHTNQLTEKSDVYSFGIVLVELLTGKKAICFERPEEERSLAMHFLSSLKRDRLFEIVENGIVKEESGNVRQQVEEVARLAARCLNVNGEERPTMKEVAMELEGLRRMEKHPWANEELVSNEETEYLLAYHEDIFIETSNANIAAHDSIRDHVNLDFSGR